MRECCAPSRRYVVTWHGRLRRENMVYLVLDTVAAASVSKRSCEVVSEREGGGDVEIAVRPPQRREGVSSNG